MTFCRTVLVGFLLTLAQAPVPVAAEQHPPNPVDGVVLRAAEDISFFEHLGILARRAVVPGARVVAPLHTYSRELACDRNQMAELIGHEGSAALVAEVNDIVFAIYYRTVGQALRAVQEHGWCPPEAEATAATEADTTAEAATDPAPAAGQPDSWYFATTLPIRTLQPLDHYISLDIDRIEASMIRSDEEEWWHRREALRE